MRHELLQHVVSGAMTTDVVHLLEVVDVAHDDGERVAIAAASLDLAPATIDGSASRLPGARIAMMSRFMVFPVRRWRRRARIRQRRATARSAITPAEQEMIVIFVTNTQNTC